MRNVLKKVVEVFLHKQENVCEKLPTTVSSQFLYHAIRFQSEFFTNNAYLFHPHIYQRLWEEFMQSWGMLFIYFSISNSIVLDHSLSCPTSLT